LLQVLVDVGVVENTPLVRTQRVLFKILHRHLVATPSNRERLGLVYGIEKDKLVFVTLGDGEHV